MMLWIIAAAFLGQAEPPPLAPKIDERVRASVVSIQNHSRPGQANGVVVDQVESLIFVLTVAHVFEAKDKLSVTVFPEGKNGSQLQKMDEVSWVARLDKNAQDLAILRIVSPNAPKLEVLPLATPETLPARMPFAAFSFAAAMPRGAQSRPEQVLAAVRKPKVNQSAEFWKTKNKPEPGRSGGPLVDAEGRLLGICSGANGQEGYYAHLSEIRKLLDANAVFYQTEPKRKNAKE